MAKFDRTLNAMICILSQSHSEISTELVMQWLEHRGAPCVRLNAADLDASGSILSFDDGRLNLEFDYGGERIRSADIRVAWFRRWEARDMGSMDLRDPVGDQDGHVFNIARSFQHLSRERRSISQGVFTALSRARWLNDPRKSSISKLETLAIAQSIGLDIPATLVTSDPGKAQEFSQRYGGAITKCVGDVTLFKAGDGFATSYTVAVDNETLNSWGGGFPCIFQERLVRSYDLRIFYLDGQCFTAALMWPQRVAESAVDSRLHTVKIVPFNLPSRIATRVAYFMNAVGLDLGCIDMIRAKDGRWVFLEVNANGHFLGEDFACNHQLHQRIADALIARLNG